MLNETKPQFPQQAFFGLSVSKHINVCSAAVYLKPIYRLKLMYTIFANLSATLIFIRLGL